MPPYNIVYSISQLSHPLYYFSPAEAHNLSAVPLWPKWLQRDRQIDPHNLARVIIPCTIFEKGDDESRYRNSCAIQCMGERHACRCWRGRVVGGREIRRMMTNVQSTCLVVCAVGEGGYLAPAAPSGHPRFDVILTIRTGAELLRGHVKNTSTSMSGTSARPCPPKGGKVQRTGKETRVR
jgi:hypothetical protein